ncbi:uncharacterized protein LOC132704736 isoform X2 [Cylas formicarius]|uniref:uncharacterized protein LOC132704736 isoform X2 n=1 Tax=Cylas formicarius TaxID=197179 RepID=UPI0029583ED1|nr:uncharacterized protein LOC132704736 isoform X2 [Cylas formicarius]
MPPYPLYNEPSIPGAAQSQIDQPVASSSPTVQSQGQLHTHSSKFPIEREVILSNADKNSKIPIIPDCKKRSKGAIAPDIPPKQMAAWTSQTQMSSQQILPDQTHPGIIQTIQQTSDTTYRAAFHPTTDYYNSGNAAPRVGWDSSKIASRPYAPPHGEDQNQQCVSVQIEQHQKDTQQKQVANGVAKTYHTIKDIISSKFRGEKDSSDKKEDGSSLNNVAEELRRSQGNVVEDVEKKTVNDQAMYNQPPVQLQYNQHVLQQHILAHHAQHYQQQHLRVQQQYSQLAQARSQEMLVGRPDEHAYYQGYGVTGNQRTPQKFSQQHQQGREQVQNHLQYVAGKDIPLDRQSAITAFERRSAQQLERDNLRQKTFETRRAASQPQLSLDDEHINETIHDNRPQPQAASISTRRGSHGNIVETQEGGKSKTNDNEKDSDDGGFLKRTGSKERYLSNVPQTPTKEVTEILQGTPRKKLEVEIGKIEGVYNVNQRTKQDVNEIRGSVKKGNLPSSAASSDYDKAGGEHSSSNVDSGRGSAAYSSGRARALSDINGGNSLDSGPSTGAGRHYKDAHDQGHESEWVDIVENELRHILEPKLHELSLHGNNAGIANSTVSESISSMTPPLPPLSAGDNSSPTMTPKNMGRYKHSSLPYGSKPDYESYKGKTHPREYLGRYNGGPPQKHRSSNKMDHPLLRGKQIFGLDTTDLTSTTTRSLDLESMLDGQTDSEGDLSTTDARAIRKQLEGLEGMYSEVLKLLSANKKHGRYQPSDPKLSKRRYGSMSSLPSSSVSSRVAVRDRRGIRGNAAEERKKVRDLRGINRRFQRLEAHVVTLARSVAHLSSEMRTQHLMIQEMETIRQEIATLRTQTNMLNIRSQSTSRAVSSRDLPTLANPTRVKKLTKFFGDEPPLLRLFLRKLGYEKYANVFETERVGMVELPYLSEERLQKMGVPLGPRLRIMQEAQISVCKDNTLCIV